MFFDALFDANKRDILNHTQNNSLLQDTIFFSRQFKDRSVVVVVNNCFTSLFGTKGLLSDILIL